MKSPPSLSKGISFEKRFLWSIFLTTAIPFLLFLVSHFLIFSEHPGRIRIFPLLVFAVAAVGLIIILRKKISSPFRQLARKAEEIQPTITFAHESKDEMTLLNALLDHIAGILQKKEKEIKDVKNRSIAFNAIATAVNQTLDLDQNIK